MALIKPYLNCIIICCEVYFKLNNLNGSRKMLLTILTILKIYLAYDRRNGEDMKELLFNYYIKIIYVLMKFFIIN